ncbi:hypothetical protein Q2941_47010 [Bradyrhizobium sp. UFLA05-153]
MVRTEVSGAIFPRPKTYRMLPLIMLLPLRILMLHADVQESVETLIVHEAFHRRLSLKV